MSFGGAIRRLGFRLRDKLLFRKEEQVCPQWRDIKETLADYSTGWQKVEARLSACLAYAMTHSRYYRDISLRGGNLCNFPVLSKADFIGHMEEIRTPDYPDAVCHFSSTSGSTGVPFRVAKNLAKRNRVLAELKAFGEFIGYQSHEKMLYPRPLHHVPFWSMFWSNVWQRDIASLAPERLEYFYREQKRGVRALAAYASTYDIMISYWLKKGYKGSRTVRTVFSGAEVLRPSTRQLMAEFWPNAMPVSRYSNMENGILGQEQGEEQKFRLNWASYYFEVLKLDLDEPAEDGELGRIVITDMYNKAFPMIRYDTGDVGCLCRPPNDWPYLSRIDGRRVDMIYSADGATVDPHTISKGLWGLKDITQWQFIQEDASAYRLTFTSTNPDKASTELKERLPLLKQILGERAEIELMHVEGMPVLASRKHKPIVQKWKKNG